METVISNVWQKSKLFVKGLLIAALVLLLMIPAYFVQELIKEREARQKEAFTEVSSKWAGKQIITGPVLVLPFWQTDSEGTIQRVRSKHYAYFLPDNLHINASVAPQEKYRGIYKVMLYSSKVQVRGSFGEISPAQLNIVPEDIIWDEAFVKLHISDNKGLNDEVKMTWKDSILPLSPKGRPDRVSNEALSSSLHISSAADVSNAAFSLDLDLNGSEELLFTPVGRATTVELNSTWPHPSFIGNTLPQTSSINSNGFRGSWKSMAHSRHFPQQWRDNEFIIADYFPAHTTDSDYASVNKSVSINSEAFGTDLYVPVNGYQKTMRSVKYAVLCILLTFVAFFLIETVNKKSVHPVHYALIGLALILFYTLLLSFSEYIGFNLA
ncbi:MAG TPA: cell envelope integrity protein CreD, partial [Chitinophagaceae bacterium]|nr:cell envelope integrity protein CreD [Chitinophagaceae bacterium]